jgi:hypothetical protein
MKWLRRKRWGAAESEAALPGVTTIPWNTLRSGTGTADRLPTLLVALVLDPEDDELRERLESEVGPSRLWAEAFPYAIPFLLRVARDPGNPAGADVAQILLSEQIYGEPYRDESPDLRARVLAAYEEGRPFFEELLHTGTPADRATAIEYLAGVYGRTDRLRALLDDPSLDHADPLIADALDDARHYLEDD